MNKGTLYILPSPIGGKAIEVLSPRVQALYSTLTTFAVERTRTTRRLLKEIDREINIDELTFFELNKNSSLPEIHEVLNALLNGSDIGIVSEAGAPGIADPGSRLIDLAHTHDIRVAPMEGPSSISQALMASGLDGQQFVFHGYLPIKENLLRSYLGLIKGKLRQETFTHIFIETPYRNQRLFRIIINSFPNHIKLCVATDIADPVETIQTRSIKEWKNSEVPTLDKRPTVFLLGK